MSRRRRHQAKKPEEPAEKTRRKNYAKCLVCNHSSPFHSSGTTRCKVLGCKCPMWQESPEITYMTDPINPFRIKE